MDPRKILESFSKKPKLLERKDNSPEYLRYLLKSYHNCTVEQAIKWDRYGSFIS